MFKKTEDDYGQKYLNFKYVSSRKSVNTSNSILFSSNKAISPVVATALLLVVAVVGVVGFQGWFGIYQSQLFVDTEVQSSNAVSGQLNIEGLVGDILYVVNNIKNNTQVNTLKISGVDCTLPSNLTLGMNEIDVSSCLSQVSEIGPSVFIATDSVVATKYVIVKGSSTNPLCRNVVALYHFDNNPVYGESNNHVYDFSGNGNNATCSGINCPIFNSTGGKFGGSYYYDGNDDFFILPEIGSGFPSSVSYWFKSSDIFRTAAQVYIRHNNGERIAAGYSTFTDTFVSSARGLQVNKSKIINDEWIHVVVSQENSTYLKIYINGIDTTQVYGNNDYWANTGVASRLGTRASTSWYYRGFIDDLAVINRSLNSDEVLKIYNSNSPLNC